MNVKGSVANRKYIAFFSLFTLIPSILISIFSLFLFSFALEKYFDSKITTVVNNSYELAKNYVQDKRNKVESDIILVAYDLNKNSILFYQDDKKNFQSFLNTQRIIRNLDQIHLLDNNKNLIISSSNSGYMPIEDRALKMVLNDDRPLKIINAFENKSAAIIKLSSFPNTFLYVVKFLEKDISKYLMESEEAINFYYTVEDKRTGIKISFILIYLVVVTLLLFLSISIAIKFSSRFFRSINNLILASTNIGKGDLDTKVPEIKTDTELETLNKNFNLMIEKLKSQQEKLLFSERHEAWEDVARKLAHEIKNPLTPIQLTIDRLRSKYEKSVDDKEKGNFNNYLIIINKQINQIENLVNEFSDFARMPKPIFNKNNIVEIIHTNISLLEEMDRSISIKLKSDKDNLSINCDADQISRTFFNLIKNSVESIIEKLSKSGNFAKFIDIDILDKNDYITIIITDNGTGFSTDIIKNITKPYFTTKAKGSGLGLSIVNKIINDHNGTIDFSSNINGAKVKINLPKN
ncbi:MAG TPA: ATP-binding protein [Candidatus Pelagibacter bacterium]|jgi:two-component system nitrogen regulation sensor histidine kinase NtrY|nr:ATP-binding protein [Candidatus Pelagibacter bacterium]|tara:strand:+ start:441 stop:2003 length:1563 start_codon:yes stop_codon:yes gene_type:complete